MKNRIFILMLVSIVVCSCNKTPLNVPDSMIPVRIAVTASKALSVPSTKAISIDGFATSSQLGIYSVLASSDDLATARNVNSGYGNVNGALYWKALTEPDNIYYPEDKSAINLFAYHPYTGQVGTTVKFIDGAAVPTLQYSLPLEQSEESALTIADLMWGSARGVAPTESGVATLEFVHKLTKVTFNIMLGDSWTEESTSLSYIKMSGTPIYKECSLVISNGVVAPINNIASDVPTIVCNYASPILLSKTNAQQCEFIAIPVADIAGTMFEFMINGVPHKVLINSSTVADVANRSFDPGSNRVFNIKINRAGATAEEINVVPAIKDWSVVNDVDLEGI